MSKAFRTKHLFQKYLNNTCTPAELEELFALLEDEANMEAIDSNLSDLWRATPDRAQAETSNLHERFQEKLKDQKPAYRLPTRRLSIIKWAAAACFVLAIGAVVFNLNTKEAVPVSSSLVSTGINPAVKRVQLSDGSIVILNKGSHLNYPTKFSGNQREVHLTGEAYFDIKHDAKRPFLVRSGKLLTRVLGTAFNIKTTNSDSQVEVVVSRGKVAVSDPKKTLAVLLPNEKISYDGNASAFRKEATNANLATLWKEEDLVLDNIPLEQAIRKIEARYGTSIKLKNEEIKNCRFTAYFLNTTNLHQVIQVISNINHLNYNQNKQGVYTLSGNGCE
jgi:transmembrane sensor